jgi:hypothetical protein
VDVPADSRELSRRYLRTGLCRRTVRTDRYLRTFMYQVHPAKMQQIVACRESVNLPTNRGQAV